MHGSTERRTQGSIFGGGPKLDQNAPLPRKVVLDWTDFCNAKCFFCGRAAYEKALGHPGGFVLLEQIRKLEPVLGQVDCLCLSSAIGEPLLHPELKQILDWLYLINPSVLLQVVTNGTSLTPQKASWFAGHLDWLSVSLNASNAEAHARDMFPDLKARQIDLQKKWDRHVGLIKAFIAALPPADRPKIRFQMVTHRHNYKDVVDFVRLVKDLGGSYAGFPNISVHPETVDWSLYWIKDEYNEMIEEACHVGAQIGVNVTAVRFYTSVKPKLDLDKICRDPVEVAYISRSNLMAPCCQWSEPGIPVDTYSDNGFERYWNSDTLAKLRKKRDSQSCKVCGMFRVFDETSFHFSPYLKKTLIEAGKLTPESSAVDYPDAALVKACVENQIDLPQLRYTLSCVNLPFDLARRIEPEGLKALEAIELQCWELFKSLDLPISPLKCSMAVPFLGVGWAAPFYTPDSHTSGRALCGSQKASLYLRVCSGSPHKLTFYVPKMSAELEAELRLEILGERLELGLKQEDGLLVLTAIIPSELTARHGGRIWIRLGCLDFSAGVAGYISFSEVAISPATELDLLKQDLAKKALIYRQHAVRELELQARVAALEHHMATLEHQLESIYQSRSWRVTAPLRTWMGRLRKMA